MTEADVEVVLQRAREQYPEARPRVISDTRPQSSVTRVVLAEPGHANPAAYDRKMGFVPPVVGIGVEGLIL